MPRLSIEPGRAIVGPSTFTLYEVGTVKEVELDGGAARTYVARRRRDERQHPHRRSTTPTTPAPLAYRAQRRAAGAARVVGKHCESGDIVVKDEFLPGDVAPGDLLAVPGTGAYCRCLASNYNHVPRPPVVAVRDGQARLIVRRETSTTCWPRRRLSGPGRGPWAPRRGAAYRPDGGTPGVQQVDTGQDESVFPAPGRGGGASVSESDKRPLRVALLGCGVVGTAVARLLTEHAADLAARVGAPLELVGIAVRRPGKDRPRPASTPRCSPPTPRSWSPAADVVVEVIGGIEPARTLILRALEHGAGVVTANKALLAEDGPTLYEAAADHGVDLYYEAAVAGAIPLLRPLRESLAGDDVRRVLGIVNGTTNFILDKMDSTGAGFAEALEEAQALGYAEADPTADVEGFDAAAKAAILASLAFHTRVSGRTSTARASPRSPPPTSPRHARWAASSSCSPSASAPTPVGRTTASASACTRR